MLFETTDPIKSRSQFKSRDIVNMAVIAALFLGSVTAWSLIASLVFRGSFFPMVLGDIAALAIAYYLYTIWHKRPIRLRCEKCEKIILSNTPWVCPACKKSNTNTTEFPFVNKCEHCGTEPKAYKCHHTHKEKRVLVFLTEDHDEINYAYALNSPDEKTKESSRAEMHETFEDELQTQKHNIEKQKNEIVLEDLKRQYEIIKNRSKPVDNSSIENKRKNLDRYYDLRLGAERVAKEKKAAIAAECKGDRAAITRGNRVVEEWLQRELNILQDQTNEG